VGQPPSTSPPVPGTPPGTGRPNQDLNDDDNSDEDEGRLFDPLAGVNEVEFAFDPAAVGDEDGDGIIEPPVDPDSVVGGGR
jgi:hypothetical protein